ncbi:hypothetical protein ISN44_As13g010610 [Arabidopsis suecica]|uniref:Uncharacterized protein n=1 Tax=Arabidopsis suecica TaxID=45249 RepID=A0A8T1XSQ8_ARASU|nr:hypothetical protein ISN44_As13g010610 [Arabidopsis suecica]
MSSRCRPNPRVDAAPPPASSIHHHTPSTDFAFADLIEDHRIRLRKVLRRLEEIFTSQPDLLIDAAPPPASSIHHHTPSTDFAFADLIEDHRIRLRKVLRRLEEIFTSQPDLLIGSSA